MGSLVRAWEILRLTPLSINENFPAHMSAMLPIITSPNCLKFTSKVLRVFEIIKQKVYRVSQNILPNFVFLNFSFSKALVIQREEIGNWWQGPIGSRGRQMLMKELRIKLLFKHSNWE
jgi:hypothetical protein